MSNCKIMVTGVSGFIGGHVASSLEKRGFNVVKAFRVGSPRSKDSVTPHQSVIAEWKAQLSNVECVVHCAGCSEFKASARHDKEPFISANVELTADLVKASVEAGVKRFIFLSSVKVLGESNVCGKPFEDADPPRPESLYAISKALAESSITEICSVSSLDFIILRLAPVYGQGMKGNIGLLIRAARSCIPLPLELLESPKSILAIRNLEDVIALAVSCPTIVRATMNVSDPRSASIAEIAMCVYEARGKRPPAIPGAFYIFKFFMTVCGKKRTLKRMLDSSVIKLQGVYNHLNWIPKYEFKDEVNDLLRKLT